MNVRKILEAQEYIDKRTDLAHKLKTNEIDALVQFFATLKENEDYDDDYVRLVADNTIKRRL